ncbi:exodeoxyribonuclease VII large subunit [Microlunatus aurantiacus]|uniref:Exodeoxyribonuclease 7 large subunit n=1 Tax=Microlunatus aurantiacus TaxID=446786 RepID=A0ABP7DUK9_9ACTN
MPLESSPDHPQPLRVVTSAVRGWIDRLGAVWVEAQVIEINRRAGSRTIFVTMRDKLANVSASVTLSPATLDAASAPLTEGATVVARLKPSYYEQNGRFSFYCDSITPIGEGQLLARLEQTKRLLQAEGLFERHHKKALPFLPRAVGLITGEGSAAERDVVENARRRWPAVRIVTRYALTQGRDAAEQLMLALAALDRDPEVDVIVVARGGGSLEDLLPFSDEGLVRAAFACRTPVVSAIGHESDLPILDLVADLRASTPTDAAKRVVPDVAEEQERVQQARDRLRRGVETLVRRERDWLGHLRARPVLADPGATFTLRATEVTELRGRAERAVRARLRQEATGVEHALARVRAMSPKATLERGYAIVVDEDGHAVDSAGEVEVGQPLLAYLHDGQLRVDVREVVVREEGAPL